MCMCNAESQNRLAKGSNFKKDDWKLLFYVVYIYYHVAPWRRLCNGMELYCITDLAPKVIFFFNYGFSGILKNLTLSCCPGYVFTFKIRKPMILTNISADFTKTPIFYQATIFLSVTATLKISIPASGLTFLSLVMGVVKFRSVAAFIMDLMRKYCIGHKSSRV